MFNEVIDQALADRAAGCSRQVFTTDIMIAIITDVFKKT